MHSGSMDKAKRGSLLRSRLRALGGVILPASISPRRKAPQRLPRACNQWTAFLSVASPMPKWLRVQIRTQPIGLRAKRIAKESALTRMSRKLCLKLPKVLP